jgi:DNA-binding transcriptional LysR family regulator
LTKQISRLEEAIGSPLFKRGRRGTELTEVGSFFLTEVRPLLQQVANVLERGRSAAHGKLGRLVIGFSFSTIDIVSRVLPQIRRRYPDIAVELHDLSSAAQLAGLANGSLQLGFVRLPVRPGISYTRILSDGLALVIPEELAASIKGFDVALLNELPFVGLQRERAPGLYEHIVRFCTRCGLHPRFVHHANESLTILALVAAGVGVAIMHKSALQNPVRGVVIHPITDPTANWDVGLAWNTDTTDRIVLNCVSLVSSAALIGETQTEFA